MTALDIITRAFKEAGILGDSDVPQGNMGPDGLTTLNGMVDSWTVDERYIFCNDFFTFGLTNGVQQYAIGPTATPPFNVPRPNKILNANLIFPSGLQIPLAVIDDDQRMDIAMPNLTPSEPFAVNYSRTYPNGTLWFWITPDGTGWSVQLLVEHLLSQFATLNTAFSFPPGYYEAIVYSLAERFCTPGWGRTADPSITSLAQAARMKIESLNLDPPPTMQCDPRAFGVGRGQSQEGFTAYSWVGSGVRFYRR